ncbi:hypothetical protein [uncultured Devosia sp.]|uniref:hypothetical protein n=1 Tax=uncultured Devosia sp. TaxID=211434 RepID=UPI0035CB3AC5
MRSALELSGTVAGRRQDQASPAVVTGPDQAKAICSAIIMVCRQRQERIHAK